MTESFFGFIFVYICVYRIMRNRTVLFSIVAILFAGLATVAFTDQTKPKKKPVKKTTPAVKPAGIMSNLTWYSMTDGFAKAQKENKMLVIDVYTDWCYWCKVMDQKTYTDPTVIKKMNEHFVAVKFNPEVNGTHVVNGESMNSEQLAAYLSKGGRIPGYPMTFIWKTISQQSTLAPYSGYIEAGPFNSILNSFIQAD